MWEDTWPRACKWLQRLYKYILDSLMHGWDIVWIYTRVVLFSADTINADDIMMAVGEEAGIVMSSSR